MEIHNSYSPISFKDKREKRITYMHFPKPPQGIAEMSSLQPRLEMETHVEAMRGCSVWDAP